MIRKREYWGEFNLLMECSYDKEVKKCQELLRRQISHPQSQITSWFCSPSAEHYSGIWDWDNYFSNLLLSYFKEDVTLVINGVLQLLNRQKSNGHTPIYITPERNSFDDKPWGRDMCKPNHSCL